MQLIFMLLTFFYLHHLQSNTANKQTYFEAPFSRKRGILPANLWTRNVTSVLETTIERNVKSIVREEKDAQQVSSVSIK